MAEGQGPILVCLAHRSQVQSLAFPVTVKGSHMEGAMKEALPEIPETERGAAAESGQQPKCPLLAPLCGITIQTAPLSVPSPQLQHQPMTG